MKNDVDVDSGRWSFPARAPVAWRARACGHVFNVNVHGDLVPPCEQCATDLDAFERERILDLEAEGLDYCLRVARARRDARVSSSASPGEGNHLRVVPGGP